MIYRFNVSLRFLTRPLIGLQYCIQIGVRNGCVPVHDSFDNLPDTRKTHLPVQKTSDCYFVCSVHDGRQRATRVSCLSRQV